MNNFPSIIKQLRESKNLTQKELAEMLGMKTYTTITKWEAGENFPKGKDIKRLAEIFSVRSDFLLGLENDDTSLLSAINRVSSELSEPRQEKVLLYSKEQLTEQQNENIIDIREFTYNYYDNAVSAGTGQYLTDGVQETITLPVDYDADFVVPICGDSMEPIYHDWDYVFIKNTYDLYDGDIGVFFLDGDAYIKELRIDEEGAFLHSLNPKYRDKAILSESDFRIIGKVIGRYNENDKKKED